MTENSLVNDKWLLLGSIDLCNSTYIKSLFENKDESYKNRLYMEYSERLHWAEFNFYRNFYRSYKNYSRTNDNILTNLFTLKNIGDEFWFCVEIPKDDKFKLANIIMALYDSVENLFSSWITIYEGNPPKVWKDIDDNQNIEFAFTNFKAYFDICGDWFEINEWRSEFFENHWEGYLDEKDRNTMELLIERLNIGSVVSNINDKIAYKTRTDYIGYEIDRFFRFTKYAAFDWFTIGENLFKNAIENQDDKGLAKIASGKTTVISNASFYYINEKYKPKGITKEYKTYYLKKREYLKPFKNGLEYNWEKANNEEQELHKLEHDLLVKLCKKYNL